MTKAHGISYLSLAATKLYWRKDLFQLTVWWDSLLGTGWQRAGPHSVHICCREVTSFLLVIQAGIPGLGILPTLRVWLLLVPVNLIYKLTHLHVQSFVSMVTLNLISLTNNINHHIMAVSVSFKTCCALTSTNVESPYKTFERDIRCVIVL